MLQTLILGTGGYQVYYGPTKGVVPWFSTALKQPMPDGLSVSDFVLDLLNADFVRSDTYIQRPHIRLETAGLGIALQ